MTHDHVSANEKGEFRTDMKYMSLIFSNELLKVFKIGVFELLYVLKTLHWVTESFNIGQLRYCLFYIH